MSLPTGNVFARSYGLTLDGARAVVHAAVDTATSRGDGLRAITGSPNSGPYSSARVYAPGPQPQRPVTIGPVTVAGVWFAPSPSRPR